MLSPHPQVLDLLLVISQYKMATLTQDDLCILLNKSKIIKILAINPSLANANHL